MKNYDINTIRASAIRVYDPAQPEDQMLLARLQYAAHMLRARTGRAFVVGDATGPDGDPVWTTVLMKVHGADRFVPVLDPADQITIVTGDQTDAVRTIRRVTDELSADMRRDGDAPVSVPDGTYSIVRHMDHAFRDAYGKDTVFISYGSLDDSLFRIARGQLPDGTDQAILVTVRIPGQDALGTVVGICSRDDIAIASTIVQAVKVLAQAAGLA